MPSHLAEEGHLPPAEAKEFQPGETGKGINIGGGHKDNPATTISVGNDKYAAELRRVWSAAQAAAGRFKSIFR